MRRLDRWRCTASATAQKASAVDHVDHAAAPQLWKHVFGLARIAFAFKRWRSLLRARASSIPWVNLGTLKTGGAGACVRGILRGAREGTGLLGGGGGR